MINIELAKQIVYDRKEELLWVRGFERSEDFTIVRSPGKIVWSRFTTRTPGTYTNVDLMLGQDFLGTSDDFSKPAVVYAGDQLFATYTLSWSDGGGSVQLAHPSPYGKALHFDFTLAS